MCIRDRIYFRRVYAGPLSLRYILAGLRAMLDTSGRFSDRPSLYDHTDANPKPPQRGKVMDEALLGANDVGLA